MARKNLKKCVALAAFVVWNNDATVAAAAFTRPSATCKTRINPVMALSPLEEQQAAAMSEYLVKAHEEKLEAVRKIEQQKEAEIDSLKKQISEMQQSPSAITVASEAGDFMDLTREQMVDKLLSYQEFMSKYIVDAQEQKMKAVEAAKEATAKKYEQQTPLLTPPKAEPEETVVAAKAPSKETELFTKRNARVSAAAEKGKSRWGDKEVERAKNSVASVAVPVNGKTQPAATTRPTPVPKTTTPSKEKAATATTTPKAAAVPVPPEVAAADRGLRNDGGVGGPSLAERVNLGADIMKAAGGAVASEEEPAATATLSKRKALFQKRNAMVVAAGKAGKSRWGAMEIERAEANGAFLAGAPKPSPVTTEPMKVAADVAVPAEVIAAADHGLRSDGGVAGPSLAERVNLGADIMKAAAPSSSEERVNLGADIMKAGAPSSEEPATTTVALSKKEALFQKRNAMVVAAGKAGKSRWGAMEIERAEANNALSAGAAPAKPSAVFTVPAEVIAAADHGLRSDGGVAGPSLEERVNLGANIIRNSTT